MESFFTDNFQCDVSKNVMENQPIKFFMNISFIYFSPQIVCNIPYLNHNQGPRNMFQYSQARQAMGLYISNYRDRLDISYILYNTQRPLVSTRATKYVNTDKLPSGENCVVAIMCYTGWTSMVMPQNVMIKVMASLVIACFGNL